MNELLCVETIVTLFHRHQLLRFLMGLGFWTGTVFLMIGGFVALVKGVNGSYWFDESAEDVDKISTTVCFVTVGLSIVGVVIGTIAIYLYHVVLTVEIARVVVPAGFDIVDGVTREVTQMLYVLRGALSR